MKLNRRGLVATIVYHTLLILLLVFAGLTFPDPPPEEEGILVNFGTDETGLGDFEPMGDDQQAGEPDQAIVEDTPEFIEETPEFVEEIPEPAQEEVVETYTPPDPVPEDNTQDVEEVEVKEDPKPTAEELERERLEQERIEKERQDQIEQERIEREAREAREEQERIEREAREEQERIERERQEQAARLNNAGRDAFGNQGVGKTEGGEGITEGDGNQGDPAGDPDADRYGTGGGLGNNGGSYGLGTRTAVGRLPLPNVEGCEVTQKIEVKVEIVVDKEGNVISATVLEANFGDDCIWDMVEEAAKKSKFSVDQSASYQQTGWIRYTIVP